MYIVPIEQVLRQADLEVLLQFKEEARVFLRDEACNNLFEYFGRAVNPVIEGLRHELSHEPVYFELGKDKTSASGERYVRYYLQTPNVMFRVRFKQSGGEKTGEGAEMVILRLAYRCKADEATNRGLPWGAFQFSRIAIKNEHRLNFLLEQPGMSHA